MAYIDDQLEPREEIIIRSKASWIAYLSAGVIFAISMYPGKLVRLLTLELALTDKRLIGTTGAFGRKLALPFKRIISVRVSQGLLGKCFGYGTIIITSRNGEKYTFKGISSPNYLHEEAEAAIEIAVLGRRLSDWDRDEPPASPKTPVTARPAQSEPPPPVPSPKIEKPRKAVESSSNTQW